MIDLTTDQRTLKEERDAERFDDLSGEPQTDASEQEFRDATLQIILQRNDFLLPNLIDMLRTHRTLEVTPHYQRRERWDMARKSKLIESFLVNIPVPPVFLYENALARYEVMDGQQRVLAILEYFENQFPLRRLDILHSLSGKRFLELPPEVRAGLERRSLQAIILLKESTPTREAAAQLRRYVFERLNTGGVRLNAQEVRNCVYSGRFNDMLVDISRNELFTRMWDIPPYEANDRSEPSFKRRRNRLFRTMGDVQLVLRVFGLLHPEDVVGGMRRTLDNAMARYANLGEASRSDLKGRFLEALDLAHVIGGDDAFRLRDVRSERGRPSASLFDGMMVAIMRKLDRSDDIRLHAVDINAAIQHELSKPEFHELVVGRANTREATLDRSLHIEGLIESVIDV